MAPPADDVVVPGSGFVTPTPGSPVRLSCPGAPMSRRIRAPAPDATAWLAVAGREVQEEIADAGLRQDFNTSLGDAGEVASPLEPPGPAATANPPVAQG